MEGKIFKGAIACLMLGLSGLSNAGFITYTSTGGADFFEVPYGVSEIRVLAIGGGAGGANGHQGGGGAGYLSTGIFSVNAFDAFSVVVGEGGTGAASGSNMIVGLTGGETSSFGSLLTSLGGGAVTGINQGGHNGSSGGGAACNSGSLGGSGGSSGSNGQSCQSGDSMPFGFGQGDYTSLLSIFTESVFSAGAGGAGGTGSHAGGGGAGGILIDGLGISASDGLMSWSGKGGIGYGAGGGAGGLDFSVSDIRFAGGDGADGLVYVEWDSPAVSVSEPSAFLIMSLGLAGLAFRKKSKNA
ncbi:PEP-CTERM sorting domain-containing protein [Photobacterium ganghwense]|uniref:PEP-CTERM sorting domain-containing protein n=1 Tax=Photobacterium ganghwense TaxID=320778 RepID=UPI001C2D2576|nr:PEP-CTERM sorting domain-containing protein [Photobacterium ganghwense]MBV1842745.1 PEP-CTERM sorting domain-containing protein [Photobacterium ganghwense]